MGNSPSSHPSHRETSRLSLSTTASTTCSNSSTPSRNRPEHAAETAAAAAAAAAASASSSLLIAPKIMPPEQPRSSFAQPPQPSVSCLSVHIIDADPVDPVPFRQHSVRAQENQLSQPLQENQHSPDLVPRPGPISSKSPRKLTKPRVVKPVSTVERTLSLENFVPIRLSRADSSSRSQRRNPLHRPLLATTAETSQSAATTEASQSLSVVDCSLQPAVTGSRPLSRSAWSRDRLRPSSRPSSMPFFRSGSLETIGALAGPTASPDQDSGPVPSPTKGWLTTARRSLRLPITPSTGLDRHNRSQSAVDSVLTVSPSHETVSVSTVMGLSNPSRTSLGPRTPLTPPDSPNCQLAVLNTSPSSTSLPSSLLSCHTPITRASSDLSLYIPCRPRSQIHARATATQSSPTPSLADKNYNGFHSSTPSPGALPTHLDDSGNPTPSRTSPSLTLSMPTPSFPPASLYLSTGPAHGQAGFLSPYRAVDFSASHCTRLGEPREFDPHCDQRVSTPHEAEYRQLGDIKFGSLRITNGDPVASPCGTYHSRPGSPGDADCIATVENPTVDMTTIEGFPPASSTLATSLLVITTSKPAAVDDLLFEDDAVSSEAGSLMTPSSPLPPAPASPVSPASILLHVHPLSVNTARGGSPTSVAFAGDRDHSPCTDLNPGINLELPQKMTSSSLSLPLVVKRARSQEPTLKLKGGYSSQYSHHSSISFDSFTSLTEAIQCNGAASFPRQQRLPQTRGPVRDSHESVPQTPLVNHPPAASFSEDGQSPRPSRPISLLSGSAFRKLRRVSSSVPGREHGSRPTVHLTPSPPDPAPQRAPAALTILPASELAGGSLLSIGIGSQRPGKLMRFMSGGGCGEPRGPPTVYLTHQVDLPVPSIPLDVQSKHRERASVFPLANPRLALRSEPSMETLRTIVSVNSVEIAAHPDASSDASPLCTAATVLVSTAGSTAAAPVSAPSSPPSWQASAVDQADTTFGDPFRHRPLRETYPATAPGHQQQSLPRRPTPSSPRLDYGRGADFNLHSEQEHVISSDKDDVPTPQTSQRRHSVDLAADSMPGETSDWISRNHIPCTDYPKPMPDAALLMSLHRPTTDQCLALLASPSHGAYLEDLAHRALLSRSSPPISLHNRASKAARRPRVQRPWSTALPPLAVSLRQKELSHLSNSDPPVLDTTLLPPVLAPPIPPRSPRRLSSVTNTSLMDRDGGPVRWNQAYNWPAPSTQQQQPRYSGGGWWNESESSSPSDYGRRSASFGGSSVHVDRSYHGLAHQNKLIAG